ncbi:MAG: clan AA aspartic protease [Chloroherpetonaceae bacterium]|nr:clan AA aspartic protease [Chloroherpetonaceae bacterium]MCS7211194.1 clan AA aspartic protease [Chloroherpetonaceae bacterium]MDW8020162.1 clan AA aspartic protease [Chloroherpetonaceae bacterium]MDW8465980.1 clan AA aspartic protease [Chloroherpetonaceae bacterium]
MGIIFADIELVSGDDLTLAARGFLEPEKVRRVKVRALVDTGAFMLAINEKIRAELDLRKVDEQNVILGDGTKRRVDVVGPVELRFQNRRCTLDALVLPNENDVLMGALPLEELDVLIDPRKQTIVINPESPERASSILKGSRLGDRR